MTLHHLTPTCRAIAVAVVTLLLGVMPAKADFTVRVLKGGTAPYLYVWDNNQTKLNGEWPGTQMTERSADDKYWETVITTGQSTINLILNMGQGTSQSNDFLNIAGVDGVITVTYDGGTNLFGTMPEYAYQGGKVAYFICPPSWNASELTCQIKHNSYEEAHSMTKIGTDGAGLDIYADFNFSGWNDTPQYVHFYDLSGNYCNYMPYVTGGYYDTSKACAQFLSLTATDFPDPNFRTAIKSDLGMQSDVFAPSSVTRLDVSNSGISALTGIEKFNNLIELIASHNSITTQAFDGNLNLTKLDMSYNSGIKGMTDTKGTSGYLYLVRNTNLEELNISHCDIYSAKPLSNNTALRVLNMAYNSRFDYMGSTTRAALTNLEWLDMSHNALTNSMGFSEFTKLKYLNVSNNTANSKTFVFKNNTRLEKLIARSCNLTATNFNQTNFAGATALKYIDLSGSTVPITLYLNDKTQLDTLILDGCTGLATSTPITSVSNCSRLKYLSFGNVDLFFNSLLSNLSNAKGTLEYLGIQNAQLIAPNEIDGFTALKTVKANGNSTVKRLLFNNCPMLEEIDITGNTALGTADLSSSTFSDPYRTIAIRSSRFTDNHHPTIKGLSGIPNTILNISGNSFTTVPTDSTFTSKFITMRNCGLTGKFTLTSQPGIVEGLNLTSNTGLTEIQINNTNFTALMLGGLTALRTLDISGNPGLTSTAGHNSDTNLTAGVGRVYLSESTALESLDISDCDIRNAATYNNFDVSMCTALKSIKASNNNGTNMTYFQASDIPTGLEELYLDGCDKLVLTTQYSQLTSKVASSLKVLDVSGCAVATLPASFSGLTTLEELRIGNNPNISAALNVAGCSNLATLNISNDSHLPELKAAGCNLSSLNLSGCPLLTKVDVSQNNFSDMSFISGSAVSWLDISQNNITGIPANTDNNCPLQTLKLNHSGVTSIDNAATYPALEYLYVKQNAFPTNYTLNGNTQLKGLAISNLANNLTSFTATNNTALTGLDLGGNTNLATLTMHGNSAMTKTTAVADDIEGGSGLYIKGLANLVTVDIADNAFNDFGRANSVLGTGIKTLIASGNQFTSFSNSNYDLIDTKNTSSTRYSSYVSGASSLEDLTELTYLDLSNNHIADSVHLWRNTKLEHLDLHGNRTLGELATTSAAKTAMMKKKINAFRKYFNGSAGISKTDVTDAQIAANANTYGRPWDLRDCDLRDTTGLFHLDLNFNTALKYIDISETNIINTCESWVNTDPGWERNSDGWYNTATTGQSINAANGSIMHHFIWMQPCTQLEEFHSDNNNMQSLGIRYYPNLHTVTASGMYGDCYLMRDAQQPGNGNINLRRDIIKYDHATYTTTSGTVHSVNYYTDQGGNTYTYSTSTKKWTNPSTTNYFVSPIKHFDVSNSQFYYVGTVNAVNIEHINISGNPLNRAENFTGNTKLQTLLASNCPDLPIIQAQGLNDLERIDVTGNTGLDSLYVHTDATLPRIDGFGSCSGLKTLYVNDCAELQGISAGVDSIGSSLQRLHAQNNTQLGSENFSVAHNTNLKTLWVSNCNLGSLSVANNAVLDSLLAYNNSIAALDLSANNNLKVLNVNDNNIVDLSLTSNTALREAKANDNNLYRLALTPTTGTYSNLNTLEYANNHINAVNLAGTTSAMQVHNFANNGRAVEAEVTIVKETDNNQVKTYRVYFFQLNEDQVGTDKGGRYLVTDLTCEDDPRTVQQTLGQDGFDMSKVTWATSPIVGTRNAAPTLDPGRVVGTIVVLGTEEVGDDGRSLGDNSGTTTYTYDTGNGNAQYYLDWSQTSDIPTDINDLEASAFTIDVAPGMITITSPDNREIIVADVQGHVLTSRTVVAGETITIDALAPGIYIVGGIKVVVP